MFKALVHKSETIAELFVADSFRKRLLGFMFHKKPHHEAILITPCNSIHTFFMRFPIDVLFINENMEVVKKLNNLNPGKIIMPQERSRMVIEGSAGLFKNIKEREKIIVTDLLFR